MNGFTTESWIWLTIICSRVSPTTNMTNISIMQAQMVACIKDNISVNFGRFVIMELKHYKN